MSRLNQPFPAYQHQRPPLHDMEFDALFKAMPPVVREAFWKAIAEADKRLRQAGSKSKTNRSRYVTARKPGHVLAELPASFADIVRRFLPLDAERVHSRHWPSFEEVVEYWREIAAPFEWGIQGEASPGFFKRMNAPRHQEQAA